VQLYSDRGWFVVDFFAIAEELGVEDGFAEVADWFADGTWIVFNAGFERRWFNYHTDAVQNIWDVAMLRKAIDGGGHFSLAQALKWDLGHELPKDEQASDWSQRPLTESQLRYAADDALWTWLLWHHWKAKADADHMRAFDMLDGMWPAVIEMEESGMLLDPERHAALVEKWRALEEERVSAIREYVGEDEIKNLNSGAQWSDFFNAILPDAYLDAWPKTAKTGLLSMANKDVQDIAALFGDNPIGEVLRLKADLTTVRKYISSFGDNLISLHEISRDGRIHARYNIAAARTGRFSSSGPNLQQIPRDRDFFGERLSVRQSFTAEPGNVLASLDYSGIELRVLALLSGDEQLLEDMIEGDVHLEVGSFWAGRRLDKKIAEDKDIRSKAKGVSFGIIYGSSELGLSGTMGCSLEKAEDLMGFWEDRYPKAFRLRYDAKRQAERDRGYLRVADGGTIYMGKEVSSTQAANYPVQRAALSIMAQAIIRHKDTLDDMRHDGHPAGAATRLIFTIHDALGDETAEEYGEYILRHMAEDMKAGFLDVFPGESTARLVEGGVGKNWGEIEEKEY